MGGGGNRQNASFAERGSGAQRGRRGGRVLTCSEVDVVEGVLDLVLGGDVFPGGQEHPLVHQSVLRAQHVHGHQAAEVEHVHIVLDGHLQGQSTGGGIRTGSHS